MSHYHLRLLNHILFIRLATRHRIFDAIVNSTKNKRTATKQMKHSQMLLLTAHCMLLIGTSCALLYRTNRHMLHQIYRTLFFIENWETITAQDCIANRLPYELRTYLHVSAFLWREQYLEIILSATSAKRFKLGASLMLKSRFL